MISYQEMPKDECEAVVRQSGEVTALWGLEIHLSWARLWLSSGFQDLIIRDGGEFC